MPKFEGTVEDIVFRNDQNGWTVASVKMDGSGRISAVGVMPFLSVGEHVIFDGELVEHRDYGQQIKVTGYESTRPETKSGVEKFLGSGLIKGVGPATAKLIVKHFGARALDVLESEPDRLIEVDGIGPKRAAMIAESFAIHNGMRNTLMFLQDYGLSPNLSMKIYKAFGEMTENVLRTNPYRLVDEISGVGFKTADEIAMSMGFSRDSEFRLRSGVKYVLSEAANGMGHMYLPAEVLMDHASRILNAPIEVVETILRGLYIDGELVLEKIGDTMAVYHPRFYHAECDAARLLLKQRKSIRPTHMKEAEILEKIEAYEQSENVTLCAQQREAALSAVREGVCIITGGPGTGKTTSINLIIRLMRAMGEVELCAPTGRAAKRMSEATGCPARTIHRLLEYNGEAQGFTKDEDDPLDADVVIVDEMSMVDVFLLKSLLSALRPGTRLILVGDADQLPSVGAGNVLRDLIASGSLPVVRLTEIFRQAQQSHIVVNAHRINHGQYPVIQNKNTDFFLERKDTAALTAQTLVGLVSARLPKYMGLDCLRDIQVMAPMKRGDVGVFALNKLLQNALNPADRSRPELARGEHVFRRGDKVMQVRNNYDLAWTRGDEEGEGVFNGDIGYIIAVDPRDRALTVEFDDGRVADYDESVLEDLDLAYCMSVHKSQGSEFAAVVLPLVSGPPMLMTRNLLYTAVTRAKRLVVIVGRESCVQAMVDNDHIMQRYSALDMRLKSGAKA
ncbi:MAG: ATP-dependent RecD-like DNA helicase [Clostridiales bacterium]|nr:ATP-dependent RecD-like DNA helicase [Clostridiales bacterium]